MTTKTVKISQYFDLEYDEQSIEFQRTLKDYKEIIDENGTTDDILVNIAQYIKDGYRDILMEGIGYIKVNGIFQSSSKELDLYCGVNLLDSDEEIEIS